jgi:hypothetical protein
LASLFVTTAMAQTEVPPVFSREFSFTTENDAYLFRKNDAYYTNGFFFALKTAKEKKGKKRVKGLGAGPEDLHAADQENKRPGGYRQALLRLPFPQVFRNPVFRKQ